MTTADTEQADRPGLPELPELLTARQVAPALGLSIRRVQALCRAGRLPSVRTGTRSVRIPARALREYLDGLNRQARASLTARPPQKPDAPQTRSLRALLAERPAPAPDTPDAQAQDGAMERLRALLGGGGERQDAPDGMQTYLRNCRR